MSGEQLSEQYVQDAFHSYLKSSLTQAKVERLLDAEVLASAEADLMITGPALCLYFAALRSTTTPPSVPLPRQSKNSPSLDLSPSNCPPIFLPFLTVWISTVPKIQSLSPSLQHDLCRIICNLEPISDGSPVLNGIAADLRAVAIEISQRRSFQERYGMDLQAAIDSGAEGGAQGLRVKASFVPPPEYQPSPPPSPAPSPRFRPTNSSIPSPPYPINDLPPPVPPKSPTSYTLPPRSPTHLSPTYNARTPSPSGSSTSRAHSPSLLAEDSPAILAIRETLYASIADVLDRTPSLRTLLKRDPPRAYFASVAFAILDVATTSITSEGSVVGVLGRELTLQECPRELRPFMVELGAIGRLVKEVEEEDTVEAMKLAQAGKDIPEPRMDRVKKMLEVGVGHDIHSEGEGRRSVEGRAVAFTNRVNALALGMTRLKAFRERQKDVFQVLAGIGA